MTSPDEIDPTQVRQTEHPIDPLFVRRWSPRAMSGRPLDLETLFRLFEAARWAPSSRNGQPWRFLYALRDSEAWATYLDLLVAGNRTWCERAGALIVVLSRTKFEDGKPSPTHHLDTGAAWENLARYGTQLGLVVHGMAGFNASRARVDLAVPDVFELALMIAVGHPGPIEELPEPLRERERPSDRKSIAVLAYPGRAPSSLS